jgi:hypothetical protein
MSRCDYSLLWQNIRSRQQHRVVRIGYSLYFNFLTLSFQNLFQLLTLGNYDKM